MKSANRRVAAHNVLVDTSVAALALLLASCGHDPPARESAALEPVQVVTVAASGEPRAVLEQVVGTVRPGLQAAVTPKVTGRILTFSVVPGTRVQEGQVIAELTVGELQASAERAQAEFEQARRERDRYERLLRQNAVTQSEFDAVDARYRVAGATLDETRTMADYRTVTAPFAGVVTRKYQEQGDLASPNQPMLELEDSTRLQLVIDVPESLAGRLQLGESLDVVIEGAGASLQGTIAELSPAADAASRTFRVKLDLPAHPELRSGQFGRAAIPRGERLAICVPAGAVVQRGQMNYVFVAANSIAKLRIVRAVEARDGQVEILSGLEVAERVIVDPPATLTDGQPLLEP